MTGDELSFFLLMIHSFTSSPVSSHKTHHTYKMGENNKPNGNDDSFGSQQPSSAAGSEKTTSFSAAFRKLLLPMGMTLLGSICGCPIYLTVVPYMYVMTQMIRSEPGETPLQWWTKYAILQAVYCPLLLGSAVVLLWPVFGTTEVTGFHALALYVPMVTISLHDRRDQYGFVGTIVVRVFFDVPLVTAGYACREFFGGLRLLAPFCTILDDNIVQGSMPFPGDIATLAGEPFNVGLVINMCREYGGATNEMKKHGIEQCHLPHQDTTAVSYESLAKGCAVIREFLEKKQKNNNKRRIFVHCKGGIARASTMVLAHYVRNEGQDPEKAIRAMKSKRPVVFLGVKDYPSIVRLNEERLSNSNNKKQQQEEEATTTKPKNQ